VKRDLIGVPVDPEGVVPASCVQEKNMQARYRGHEERDQKVEGEKTSKRGVVHREASPESRY